MIRGVWAVVPAAGRGTRFGGETPKQYLDAGGKPLLAHTLEALLAHPQVSGAMLVIGENDDDWAACHLLEDGKFAGKPVLTTVGGATRAASVLNGIHALPGDVRADDFVLVHDAARPNLALDDVQRLLDKGREDPVGAILAAPVRDTLKRAGDDGGIDATEPRSRLWRAFTPQMFRRLQLVRALEDAAKAGVECTDEAMAMERQGARPLLVEGSEDNFKITTPADLVRFKFILSQRT